MAFRGRSAGSPSRIQASRKDQTSAAVLKYRVVDLNKAITTYRSVAFEEREARDDRGNGTSN